MNKKNIITSIILLAILSIAFYFLLHYDLHRILMNREKAKNFINSFGDFAVPVFIFIQVLQVILAPIPGEVTGIIGGYMYGTVLGTIYSTIGLTIGSWLAFSISKVFGMPVVEKMIKKETIAKYDHFLEHRGLWVSFVLFIIPGFPKDALSYIMGLSHMTITTFLIISTSGRFLGTVFLSVMGSLARDGRLVALSIIFVASVFIAGAAYYYRETILKIIKRMKKHDKEAP